MKELIGIKESDTGLSQPSQWDLVSDKQMMQEEQPLQVRNLSPRILPRDHSPCRPLSARKRVVFENVMNTSIKCCKIYQVHIIMKKV